MIINGCQVVVSRKWDNPQIHVEIIKSGATIEEIAIKLDMNDFAEALKQELFGAITMQVDGFIFTLKKEAFKTGVQTRKNAHRKIDEIGQKTQMAENICQGIDAAVLRVVKGMKDVTRDIVI